MANWSDTLYLIGKVKGVDDDGYEVIKDGKPRLIYANRKSVRSQEFHMAKQQGVTLSYMFEVRANEYHGEEKVEYQNKDYSVYRTYEKGEFIELIVQRPGDDHGY